MTFLARHNQERCVELERKDRLAYYVKCQSKGGEGVVVVYREMVKEALGR